MLVLNRPSKPPPGWGSDYQTAAQEAVRQGKPLLVDFYLDSCPPCKAMDRTTLRSAKVVQALAGFIPVRVDLARAEELAARLEVDSAPTYFVLDATGRPVRRLAGYVGEQEFLRFLAQAGVSRD